MVLSVAGFLDKLEASGVTEKGIFMTVGIAFFVLYWLCAWNCGRRWARKREKFLIKHIRKLTFSREIQPTVFRKEMRRLLAKEK